MPTRHEQQVRSAVRERYGSIAQGGGSCCGPESSCCETASSRCGTDSAADRISREIGYADGDLEAVPEGANLGLGCGNPVAVASLCEGETVVDLGSGAGFDCFLAAARVGPTGKVIGVDMTVPMLEKARQNAAKGGYEQVEFRLGEIENLPLADGIADAVISNCVINFSPDKQRVFREAHRVLRPGGRVMVSDIVLTRPLPAAVRDSVAAYVGCVAGALMRDEYLAAVSGAGFEQVEVVEESAFSLDCVVEDPVGHEIAANLSAEELESAAGCVHSIRVRAVKPAQNNAS